MTVYANNGDIIVHRTKTGSKYHSAGCGHLHSDIPVTLHDAVMIYNLAPCADCNPPIYSGANNALPQEQVTRADIDAIYDAAETRAQIDKIYDNAEKKPKNHVIYYPEYEASPHTIVYVRGIVYHYQNCVNIQNYDNVTAVSLLTAYENEYEPCTSCSPPSLTADVVDAYYNDAATSASDSPETYTENAITKETELSNSSKKEKHSNILIYLLMASPLLGVILMYIGTLLFDSLFNKKKEKEETVLFLQNYNHYFSLYAFYDPLSFVNAPKAAYIKNGLPATNGPRIYGKYTVYTSPTGKCFHQNPKCARTLQPTNYAYAYHLSPCRRCVKDGIPELQWFWKYREIAKIKKYYQIP